MTDLNGVTSLDVVFNIIIDAMSTTVSLSHVENHCRPTNITKYNLCCNDLQHRQFEETSDAQN